jgi:hypothetical protein
MPGGEKKQFLELCGCYRNIQENGQNPGKQILKAASHRRKKKLEASEFLDWPSCY